MTYSIREVRFPPTPRMSPELDRLRTKYGFESDALLVQSALLTLIEMDNAREKGARVEIVYPDGRIEQISIPYKEK